MKLPLEIIDGTAYYVVPIHPSMLADLVAMEARAKWKAEHRRRRMLAKDGGLRFCTSPDLAPLNWSPP